MARHQAREEAAEEGEAEAPPAAGSYSPLLPVLPPRGNDDAAANGPPLACGSTSEAVAFEVAALIIA
jgi:hypothetical protein